MIKEWYLDNFWGVLVLLSMLVIFMFKICLNLLSSCMICCMDFVVLFFFLESFFMVMVFIFKFLMVCKFSFLVSFFIMVMLVFFLLVFEDIVISFMVSFMFCVFVFFLVWVNWVSISLIWMMIYI